jgi:predicted DNA-binding helix-hairpin-helix protein
VARILEARRHRAVRMADLARLRLPLAKIAPFILAPDHRPAMGVLDSAGLRQRLTPGRSTSLAVKVKPRQLSLNV